MYEGQMITSGLNNSGDVILAPEKKSHKKWIIIGSLVLVFIVVLVVVFVIPKGNKGNVNGDGKSAYNRYANYLVYGNDSTEKLEGNYEDGLSNNLLRILGEESKSSSTFAQNMETLWGDFIKKSSDFTVEGDLTRDNYKQRVDFMVTYLNNYSNMNEERIIELAQNSADEKIEEAFDEYFALYNKYDFSDAKAYSTDGRSYFQSIVDWVKALNEAGCNSGNVAGIEEECNMIYSDGEDKILDYSSYAEGAINNVANYLVKNAWAISKYLNGGNA